MDVVAVVSQNAGALNCMLAEIEWEAAEYAMKSNNAECEVVAANESPHATEGESSERGNESVWDATEQEQHDSRSTGQINRESVSPFEQAKFPFGSVGAAIRRGSSCRYNIPVLSRHFSTTWHPPSSAHAEYSQPPAHASVAREGARSFASRRKTAEDTLRGRGGESRRSGSANHTDDGRLRLPANCRG